MERLRFALAAAALLAGCGARSLVPDAAGTGTGGSGTGGGGTGECLCPQTSLLSDFEDLAQATVVRQGTPPRNGYWYTYNDGSGTCQQRPNPAPGGDPPGSYVGEAPPTSDTSGIGGSLALHARWTGCDYWGAGIGADINVPVSGDGGIYSGPKVPYDLSPYTGLTFWAMATIGSDTALRLKLPMTDETSTGDGGNCVESATTKCSDNFGETFNLPANGNWKQVTVRFSDRAFAQQGWGAPFLWNPAHVTSIQIESSDKGELYDFWIDDIYLLP